MQLSYKVYIQSFTWDFSLFKKISIGSLSVKYEAIDLNFRYVIDLAKAFETSPSRL